MAALPELTESAIVASFDSRSLPITYNGTDMGGVFRFLQVDTETRRGASESTRADQATLLVLKSKVADPGYGDSVVVESKTWRVMRKLKGGGAHTFKLLLERNRGRVA